MTRFLLKRLGLSLVTLVFLSILVFALAQLLPGDIGRNVLGNLASQHDVDVLNHSLGVDLGELGVDGHRHRLGEQVDELMAGALASTSGRYEALFYGVDLKQQGRADYDQMLANVADLPAAERRQLIVAALKDVLGAVQAGVRASRGSEEEAVVSGIVKDGLRRIGAA